MKKLWILLLVALLLTGCGKKATLETIGDVQDTPVAATMQQVLVDLPPELSTPTLQDEGAGKLHLCDDYTVMVQTLEAGDLKRTIQTATGMDMENLQMIQTKQGAAKRYQFVWASNGENGIQVGRACILDDGAYHYVLTAMADESKAGKVQPTWQEIFASFRVIEETEQINTGS
jgi:hypothetical protein